MVSTPTCHVGDTDFDPRHFFFACTPRRVRSCVKTRDRWHKPRSHSTAPRDGASVYALDYEIGGTNRDADKMLSSAGVHPCVRRNCSAVPVTHAVPPALGNCTGFSSRGADHRLIPRLKERIAQDVGKLRSNEEHSSSIPAAAP